MHAAIGAPAPENATVTGYRHEAAPYDGPGSFVERVLDHVAGGAAAGQPVLVVAESAKIDRLRRQLGPNETVLFEDVDEVGRNPGRLIAVLEDFVRRAPGTTVARGVCEPAHVGRTPDELDECVVHEALLNLAFPRSLPLWLRCPIDTAGLPPEVSAGLLACHPHVAEGAAPGPANEGHHCLGPEGPYARALPTAPAGADGLAFWGSTLNQVRAFVADHGHRAGLDDDRTSDLLLAVNELAANSVRHGGGVGTVTAWCEAGRVILEVADRGHVTDPLVGRLRPGLERDDGRGVWLAHQVADLVQMASTPDAGTRVRVQMRRG